VASVVGVLSVGQEDKFNFQSVRGESVEIYGGGVYRFDAVFQAGANQGTDVLNLSLGIPLILATAFIARRGSLRAALLHMGVLGYFLYLYASLALHTAYNDLFLVYVAIFSASLYALIFALNELSRADLTQIARPGLPRKAPAIFMLFSAFVVTLIWLVDPASALFGDSAPNLALSDTYFTNALDIAVIAPAAALSGSFILRSHWTGYLGAFSLLVLEVMLAPMIALQTAFQLRAGESFTAGEIIGPIAGFVTMAILGLWILVSLLRSLDDAAELTRR
jgi:hypothetical protein